MMARLTTETRNRMLLAMALLLTLVLCAGFVLQEALR